MSAVIEYPEGTVAVLSTTPVSGIRMLSGRTCTYPPAIDARDLVEVDFDVRGAGTGGGLYLVEVQGAKAGICRRFITTPHGLEVDRTGNGDWQFIDLDAVGWRIVGLVRQVYKPAGT